MGGLEKFPGSVLCSPPHPPPQLKTCRSEKNKIITVLHMVLLGKTCIYHVVVLPAGAW